MPISLEPKTDDSNKLIELRSKIIPEWSYKIEKALKCTRGKCQFTEDLGQLMPFAKFNLRSDKDREILMTWYAHFVKVGTPCILVKCGYQGILYKPRRVLTHGACRNKLSDKSQFQYK
jgi:hypothetical protein